MAFRPRQHTVPLLLAFAAMWWWATPASTTLVDRWSTARAAARELALRHVASGPPGISVAVARDGEVLWAEAFGVADLAGRTPVTTDTRFRIASISKPLTAACLARIWERGGIDLDAPIQRYLPEFPDKQIPITTRQLAGHLAGIRHYRGDEFHSARPYPSVRAALAIFAQDPLLHAPGSKYAYTTYGFNLLSAVLEGATGREFLELMEQEVFTPLALRATGPDRAQAPPPSRTHFYQRDAAGRVVEAPFVDLSCKWAGGGFLSTATDLVRFGAAHLGPGYLQRATLALWHTPQTTKGGEATRYGMGWVVERDPQLGPVVLHTGGAVGGTSMLLLVPGLRISAAVLSNLEGDRTLRADFLRMVQAFAR